MASVRSPRWGRFLLAAVVKDDANRGGLMQSPHAIAALAFVHSECSTLGRIQNGSNEIWFFAAFVAGRAALWF
jgi:hypothetical protein